MPDRMWRHDCCGSAVRSESPECDTCGLPGTFDGWRLNLWEAARVYHYVYGFHPFGPHRPDADGTLTPLRDTCVRCDGRAILTIDVERWAECPMCEGTGGVWNRPFAEVDAVWAQVAERWPGAVLRWANAYTWKPARRLAPRKPPMVAGSPRPVERPRGTSPDGIKYDAVRRVFAQAERALGTRWQLSGHGHEERVTLKAHYSRHARLGAPDSVKYFCPAGCIARRWIYPAALVRRAASILKIDPNVLVSRWL